MGLFVGGTGSANQLDDYEEGTCTLQLETHSDKTNVSTSGNTTLDVTGNYVKVGQYCMVTGLFNNLNNTTINVDNQIIGFVISRFNEKTYIGDITKTYNTSWLNSGISNIDLSFSIHKLLDNNSNLPLNKKNTARIYDNNNRKSGIIIDKQFRMNNIYFYIGIKNNI